MPSSPSIIYYGSSASDVNQSRISFLKCSHFFSYSFLLKLPGTARAFVQVYCGQVATGNRVIADLFFFSHKEQCSKLEIAINRINDLFSLQIKLSALIYLCKEGQKRLFKSFIVKHSKAKRSEDSHICQKTVSKARI